MNFELPDFPELLSPPAEQLESHDDSTSLSSESISDETQLIQAHSGPPQVNDASLEDSEVLRDKATDNKYGSQDEAELEHSMDIDNESERSESWVEIDEKDVQHEGQVTRAEINEGVIHKDRGDTSFSTEKDSPESTEPDDFQIEVYMSTIVHLTRKAFHHFFQET